MIPIFNLFFNNFGGKSSLAVIAFGAWFFTECDKNHSAGSSWMALFLQAIAIGDKKAIANTEFIDRSAPGLPLALVQSMVSNHVSIFSVKTLKLFRQKESAVIQHDPN